MFRHQLNQPQTYRYYFLMIRLGVIDIRCKYTLVMAIVKIGKYLKRAVKG